MKNNKGFTLVELVVVMTVMLILGIISFVSLGSYVKDSRDATRVSDVNIIVKSLDLFKVDVGRYPVPDNPFDVTFKGKTIFSYGELGDNVFTNVNSVNKVLKDPLYGNNYSYGVLDKRKEYQIGLILEEDTASYYSNSANALGYDGSTFIRGNYNGLLLKTNTGGLDYVLAIPSLILENKENTDIGDIIQSNSLVYNGFNGFPSTYTEAATQNDFNFNTSGFEIFSGSLSTLSNEANRLNLANNLKNAYIGTSMENEDDFLSKINSTEIDLLLPSEKFKLLSCDIVNHKVKHFVECGNLNFITFYVSNILNIDITDFPGNKINSIYQDSNGVYWFGTNGGLVYYDPENVIFYDKNNSGLIHNNVTSITQDSSGNYWFGTVNGVSKFDGVSIWTDYGNSDLVGTHIQYIYTSSDGTIWIGTNSGISAYNSDIWSEYTKSSGLSHNNISSVFEDSSGYLWFGTNSKGVDRFFKDGSGNVTIDNYRTGDGLASNKINYVYQDSSDNMYFGTNNGYSLMDSLGTITNINTSDNGASSNDVTYFYEDSNNNLWIGTKGGLLKYSGSTFTVYDSSNGLVGDDVIYISESDDGNISIFTDGGLNVIDDSGNIVSI